MTAAYDESLLLAYLEGDATETQAAEAQALIDQDPKLRRLLSQMRTDRMALMSLPVEPAPAGLVQDILAGQERRALLGEPLAALPAAPAAQRTHRFTRVAGYFAAAAAIGLCATVLFDVLQAPEDLSTASEGLDRLAMQDDATKPSPNPARPDPQPLITKGADSVGSDSLGPNSVVSSAVGSDVGGPGLTPDEQAAMVKTPAPKAGLQHAAQPRQLEWVAVSQSPETARSAISTWAAAQGLSVTASATQPDGSQTFIMAWRASADINALKTQLREYGQARFTQEGASPAIAGNPVPSNWVSVSAPLAGGSLEQLTVAALAARVVGVAVAHAHNEPVLIDNPRGLMRLLDHATGGYASGAEFSMALGRNPSGTRPSRWITDTPTIDQTQGPEIRITLKPAELP